MKFFPLLLIALFLLGCASSGEVSQVKQDMTSVYTEQTSYMQKTDARLSRLEKEMKDIGRAMGSPDSGLRKEVVDLSIASENRDEKIKAILGRLDELDSQLRAYWEDMKGQLRELKKTAREGARPASGGAAGANPEDLYRQGFDAFQKGAYKDAVPLFAQFVQQNPTAPLAPNAYYWMGESYMNEKAYEKAIVQFQEVVDRFQNSDKAAKAIYRQAEAFAAIGDKKSSTTDLKRVIELFPKTEEARLADRALRSGAFQ
jgi:tol-pal system protein YbgF